MKLLISSVFLCFAVCGTSLAQTSDRPGAPELPPPYATPSNENFSAILGWNGGRTPKAPEGLKVNLFAGDLASPRQLLVLPNGDVLVAEAKTEEKPNDPTYRDKGANRIRILRDTNNDGQADISKILISGLRQPYGMVLLGQRLYIADTDGVFWIPYQVGQTDQPDNIVKTKIASFTPGGYNNHWTRNLIASPDGKYLYVAIGSASNAGEYGEAEEVRRANILRIEIATNTETVYASGLRNPVGMDFEPHTHTLWAAVNERDHLGDNLVPDYITSVKSGGFYGWPYSYYGQHEDPRLKGQHPELVARAIVPDFSVGPHVAALGIVFADKSNLPAHYRQGAFVSRHGSWNRATLSGYDVIFIPFSSDGMPSGPMEPFLTGFIADDKSVFGRPRSLAIAADGSLLVTDDATGTIWRVSH